MPSNPKSLAVTERYRAGMLDLRHRAEREAKRAWGAIRASDLDATYPVGQLALSVTGLQREGARLASAYLAAFVASETGNPVRTPPVTAAVIGESRKGGPLTTVLRSPLLDVKQAIGRGTPPGDALRAGGKRLVRMVGLATDTAVREAQRVGMEDHPEITGWRRAVRGTCDACVGLATESNLPAGEALEIHPNCQCISEPSVRLRSAATMARTQLREDQARYLVTNYLGNPRGFDVNQYLRGAGRERSPRVTEKYGPVVKEMDRIFSSVPPLGEPVQAWRGGPGLGTMHLPTDVEKLRGHTFTDKGFMSTTHDLPYVENHNTLWNLTIDPRVKGIYGYNAKESELLLQRDLRVVITNATKRTAPAEKRREQVLIEAKVLPPKAVKAPPVAKPGSARDVGATAAKAAVDQVADLKTLPMEDLPDDDTATARFVAARDVIQTHPDASVKSATNAVVHEYGHFADRTLGGGHYLTESVEGDPLYQVLKNSPTMRAVANDEIEILKDDVTTRGYFLQGKEMFARAFQQYVAITSKDSVLLKELRQRQADKYMSFTVWQDDEFEPIAQAIERLLKEKGLAP